MRILQVALGVSPTAGGPVRSITGLTRALSNVSGCAVDFFVHDPDGVERFDLGNTRVIRGHRVAGTVDRSDDFANELDAFMPDVVHFHGLWSWTLHLDQVACRKRGIPYVIAPRGSLDAWSLRQKWWKKRVALALFQMRDLRLSAALHVTATMEKTHCKRIGYDGKFILCPNGVNLPASMPMIQRAGRRVLFMSRMHPKKGVIELVEAWHRLGRVSDGWVCELVYTLNGPEEVEYEAKVRGLVERLGLEKSFVFTGELDDESKWQAYRRADLFVLPTHSENFGIVIAEAAYAGLPVITTTNAPWDELIQRQAGWWIDLTLENLVHAMAAAMKMSDRERSAMGENAHALVVEKYSWDSLAESMVKQYGDLISQQGGRHA